MARKTEASVYNSLFPSRLKTLLLDAGISQQELGAVLGVQRQTINMYVNGQIRPDIDALAIIANYFNVTTDWLLGLTDDRERKPAATDELQLSEEAIKKIKSYNEWDTVGYKRLFSSLDAIIVHDDFDELLGCLDNVFSECHDVLSAHTRGCTESDDEKKAIKAAEYLKDSQWTVITSAKHAMYLIYCAQQVFSRIINDISDAERVCDIMEY